MAEKKSVCFIRCDFHQILRLSYFLFLFAPSTHCFQFTSRLAPLSDCRDALVLDDTTVVGPLAFILFHLSAKEQKSFYSLLFGLHLFAPANFYYFTLPSPCAVSCYLSPSLSFPFSLLASRIYGYFFVQTRLNFVFFYCCSVFVFIWLSSLGRSNTGGLYFGFFFLLFHLKHTSYPCWHGRVARRAPGMCHSILYIIIKPHAVAAGQLCCFVCPHMQLLDEFNEPHGC